MKFCPREKLSQWAGHTCIFIGSLFANSCAFSSFFLYLYKVITPNDHMPCSYIQLFTLCFVCAFCKNTFSWLTISVLLFSLHYNAKHYSTNRAHISPHCFCCILSIVNVLFCSVFCCIYCMHCNKTQIPAEKNNRDHYAVRVLMVNGL